MGCNTHLLVQSSACWKSSGFSSWRLWSSWICSSVAPIAVRSLPLLQFVNRKPFNLLHIYNDFVVFYFSVLINHLMGHFRVCRWQSNRHSIEKNNWFVWNFEDNHCIISGLNNGIPAILSRLRSRPFLWALLHIPTPHSSLHRRSYGLTRYSFCQVCRDYTNYFLLLSHNTCAVKSSSLHSYGSIF